MTAPVDSLNSADELPGHFGPYGGRFVPEALMAALDELEEAFDVAIADPEFIGQLAALERDYTGRPSPLTRANRFEQECGGARVYFKREDLNHTGSHKINNVLGQALLTKRMGKTRIIAETGQVNMAWLPRQPLHCWALSALSTWARKTPSAKRSMLREWNFSVEQSYRLRPEAKHSKTPSTRPCATG